ncbi:MAG: DUF559 domain-containing protein [Candidatus Roizmanbacteria bacterium]|nr:MAG: DUF559 domain-containing protein [Candidatus Roizmanbacteria bacterium]
MSYTIPYNPKLKKIASHLRKNSTVAEIILWKRLKNKQVLGIDFNRQKPLGNYIVDFYNNLLKLAIEIDGDSHELKGNYDEKRQDQLYKLGINILRFTNDQVKNDMDGVIVVIKNWITMHKTSNRD